MKFLFLSEAGRICRILSPVCENLAELVALTRKGVPFVWADEQQTAIDAHKACLFSAPI